MMTEKRFTVPLKYSLSHSKIQCDGTPLTNDELIRILNTNDGAFVENFSLKQENEQLKKILNDTVNQLDIEIGDDYSQYWVGVVIDKKMFRKIKEICK